MTPVCWISFVINFVAYLSGSHSALNEHEPKYPVCVIGAGISGLNLGKLLQERGYDVHVFEKSTKVGGKIDTFTIGDEAQVEMCPLFYTTSNTLLRQYIDELGLTSVVYNQADRVAFDPRSGTVLPFPPVSAQEQAAAQQYIALRSQYTSELDFGYLQATTDLFEPASTWLNKRNLTALTPLFEIIITVEGYGSLHDTPALYMLKFVTNDFLLTSLNVSGQIFNAQRRTLCSCE